MKIKFPRSSPKVVIATTLGIAAATGCIALAGAASATQSAPASRVASAIAQPAAAKAIPNPVTSIAQLPTKLPTRLPTQPPVPQDKGTGFLPSPPIAVQTIAPVTAPKPVYPVAPPVIVTPVTPVTAPAPMYPVAVLPSQAQPQDKPQDRGTGFLPPAPVIVHPTLVTPSPASTTVYPKPTPAPQIVDGGTGWLPAAPVAHPAS